MTSTLDKSSHEVGQSFAVSGVVDPRGVPGLVLSMRFARVEGISGNRRPGD